MVLWQLAEAGVSTVGFEQYGVGHDRAAAGGESRIFRTAYLEGPQYVPLLSRAHELWGRLESESGRALLTLNGGLMIGPHDSEEIVNVLASAQRYDLPYEVLEPQAMAERYPQHRLQPGEIAVLDRRAGVLRPEFAVRAAVQCALGRGASVVTGTRVLEIDPDPYGVRVRAGDRDYRFEQVVVTAGPWTGRFAPELDGSVSAEELVMTWYPARDVEAYTPDRFPVFIRAGGEYGAFGIPTLDGGSVKVAAHAPYARLQSADALDRNVDPQLLDPINETVANTLPGLDPYPVRVSAYMDAYTADGHGLVGAMPGAENVWVLGGFSGHGFKMSPAFGQIAADLVQHGTTAWDIGHLRPDRFLRT